MKNILLSIIILLKTANTLYSQDRRQSGQNGDFRLTLMLPHFNTLSFFPDRAFRDVEYGFNGYGAGLEYNYLDNKSVSLSYSFVMTFEWFLPVPVDAEYNKIMYSSYVNVTDNIVLGNFTLGYGIHYSANTWKEWTRNLDTLHRRPIDKKTFTNNNLGLTFNAWFKAGRTLHLGLIYQPSLLRLNTTPNFIYEHSISAGVIWRFKLFNAWMKRYRMLR